MEQNTRTALTYSAIAAAMLGLGFASKPLYDTFCRVTGFGGTTQVATEAPGGVLDRAVTVRFDSNVNGAPLRFRPLENEIDIRLGEHGLAFYEVTNTSSEPITAVASYNVTPHKAGRFYNKLECFCFEERVFAPGETKRLPVVFFISPLMDEDRLMDDVRTITLSYTYFLGDTPQGATNGGAFR